MSSFFIKFHQKFLSLKLQSQIINYCIFHVIVLNLEAENKIQEKHTPPPKRKDKWTFPNGNILYVISLEMLYIPF
jgi:hypothetical protein